MTKFVLEIELNPDSCDKCPLKIDSETYTRFNPTECRLTWKSTGNKRLHCPLIPKEEYMKNANFRD